MKKIVLLYLAALLVCFALGAMGALIKFYSWWYIILAPFLIWAGSKSLVKLTKLTKKNPSSSAVFFIICFFVLILLLVIGAEMLPEISFLTIVIAAGVFGGLLEIMVLLLGVRELLIENS